MTTKRQEDLAQSVLTICIILGLLVIGVVGVSYGLFTDQVKVEHHLMTSGTLDVTLKRTSLEYTQLNNDGYLETVTVAEELDLTNPSTDNVFGLDAADAKIVPGSYFDAQLAIGNNGDVAFDYSVEIKLLTEDDALANELAQQLKVTITNAEGVVVAEYKLSDLSGEANCEVKAGHMQADETSHNFGVKVEFIDQEDNNDAKLQEVAFDLIVSAVQATTPAAE